MTIAMKGEVFDLFTIVS